MADIIVKLKIHETGNGTIDSIEPTIRTNNVSSMAFSDDIISWANNLGKINRNFDGATGTQLGLYKLGTSKLGIHPTGKEATNVYNGIMFGHTNSNQKYLLTLVVEGTDLGNFAIQFDKTINNYPTSYKLIIDNVEQATQQNNSSLLELTGISGNARKVEIVFENWHLANSIVAITYIDNQIIEETLDKSWITSFTSQNQMTSTPTTPLPNVLSNTGSIELIDKNNRLLSLSKNGYLKMNTFSVEIYINGQLMQRHNVIENPYYSADKTMQISLTNEISKFDISVPEKTYSGYTSLYTIFSELLMNYGGYTQSQVEDMLSKGETQDGINVVFPFLGLQFFYVKDFTLKSGTLLQQIEKFCSLAIANFYIEDGKSGLGDKLGLTSGLIMVSSKPSMTYSNGKYKKSEAILIPYNQQVTALSYDILVNNIYDDVQVNQDFQSVGNRNILKYGSNEFYETSIYSYTGSVEEMPGELTAEASFIGRLRNTIKTEYDDGLKTASIDIFPNDFTRVDGTKLNWAQGDMIKVNDLVIIEDKDGNPSPEREDDKTTYWRVCDRTVKYDGQIIVSLVLQEMYVYET